MLPLMHINTCIFRDVNIFKEQPQVKKIYVSCYCFGKWSGMLLNTDFYVMLSWNLDNQVLPRVLDYVE